MLDELGAARLRVESADHLVLHAPLGGAPFQKFRFVSPFSPAFEKEWRFFVLLKFLFFHRENITFGGGGLLYYLLQTQTWKYLTKNQPPKEKD